MVLKVKYAFQIVNYLMYLDVIIPIFCCYSLELALAKVLLLYYNYEKLITTF